MAVIQSSGQLAQLDDRDPFGLTSRGYPGRSIALYDGVRQSIAKIIRTQPNVRTVISFLARNIAQLGVQVFERVDENDRQRIIDHPFVDALRRPNPADRHMTTYRLMHRLVWDVCSFDVAFWGLFPIEELGRSVILPLRPELVETVGHLWPTMYKYHAGGKILELPPERVVYIQASHDLDDPLGGTSPIETLRRIIAEDDAAGVHREQFWRSGARLSGVIERPTSAPDWSDTARLRFKEDWDDLYTGHGEKAGGTPILEDDMVWKEAGTANARSSQYVESRKLSREEAAAVYHIDPIWVGIDSAGLSFSSVKERHKALYQDTLGPWISMLDQDLTFQALPSFEDDDELLNRMYVKLNIAEKLRGSVEDQAASITQLTGRPIFSANEGRALLEKNSVPEGDGLAVPLNLTVLGSDIPDIEDDDTDAKRETRRALGRGMKTGITQDQHHALETEHAEAHRLGLVSHFNRQKRAIIAAFGDLGGTVEIDEVYDSTRWDIELETDLFALALSLAGDYGPAVAESLAFDDLDVDLFVPYLSENARIAAENINATTRNQVEEALLEEDRLDAIRNVFTIAATSRAVMTAQTRYTSVAGFTGQDTATQAGRSQKEWIVTSANSRHPGLDGELVDLGDLFSNGLAWPGDATGGPDETAGCLCMLNYA